MQPFDSPEVHVAIHQQSRLLHEGGLQLHARLDYTVRLAFVREAALSASRPQESPVKGLWLLDNRKLSCLFVSESFIDDPCS